MGLPFVIDVLSVKISSLAVLKKFVSDDLGEFLVNLGELDYRAAITAFRDSTISAVPEREITIGLTCLRMAHQKFYEVAKRKSVLSYFGDTLLTTLTFGGATPSRLKGAEKCVEVSLILAASYSALGEKSMITNYVRSAREVFDTYAKLYVQHAGAKLGMSGIGSAMSTEMDKAEQQISGLRERLSSVCRELEEIKT
jgi:hypothetical protein